MSDFGEYDLEFAPFIVHYMYSESGAWIEKPERYKKLHGKVRNTLKL